MINDLEPDLDEAVNGIIDDLEFIGRYLVHEFADR